MYIVNITNYMINMANERTDMFMKHLYNRFGLNDAMRREKAYIGIVGEFAFASLCDEYNIPYTPGDYIPEENSDTCDFYINNYKIDIKVAKLTTNNSPNDYWTYGYPVEQHPISKDAIIVGLYDAFQETVLFYGIISGKKVSRFPIVTSNSYAGYQYYTPNHEFTYGDLNKDIIGIIQQYFL